MALTKTQINYLENKLDRVSADRLDEFKKSLGSCNKTVEQVILDRLNNGSVKLLSKSQIIEKFNKQLEGAYSYYSISMRIRDMISKEDEENIEREVQADEDKIQKFKNKLQDAKQNALDKIVLEGVDVETAINELKNIQ